MGDRVASSQISAEVIRNAISELLYGGRYSWVGDIFTRVGSFVYYGPSYIFGDDQITEDEMKVFLTDDVFKRITSQAYALAGPTNVTSPGRFTRYVRLDYYASWALLFIALFCCILPLVLVFTPLVFTTRRHEECVVAHDLDTAPPHDAST